MTHVNIEAITPTIGAYVHGTPAQLLADGAAEQCLEALNKHLVLIFPQVNISDEDQVAFSNKLGVMRASSLPSNPESASQKLGIYPVSLDPTKAKYTDYVRSNENWHLDGTTFKKPPKATNLKCEVPPSSGGDTGFANLYAAYADLPDDKKAQLEGLKVIHSAAAANLRFHPNPSDEDLARWNEQGPPTEQPLVWKQNDGSTSLVIGSTASHIVGMSAEDSEALLQELLAWCTQEKYCYRHQWQKGDMVIFNNYGLLHKSYPYTVDSGRLMHRTVIMGEEAFA